jgi:hypothetical protein
VSLDNITMIVLSDEATDLVITETDTETVTVLDETLIVLESTEGPPGLQGPPGPPGGARYLHTQAVPSSVWTIHHMLQSYPTIVTMQEIAPDVWEQVWPIITYPDADTAVATFGPAMSGQATAT